MKGRQFFLLFFLALAGSTAIVLFFDFQPKTGEAIRPLQLSADLAVPLGTGKWVVSWIARSESALPYIRTTGIEFDGEVSQNVRAAVVPVGRLMEQSHYVGRDITSNTPAALFWRESVYIPTLTGSQIMARLSMPSRVDGMLVRVAPSGATDAAAATSDVQALASIAETTLRPVALSGGSLPGICLGEIRIVGQSENGTAMTASLDEKRPWIDFSAPVDGAPFCGSDGNVWARSDKHSLRFGPSGTGANEEARVMQLPHKLVNRFALDGTWLGIEQMVGPAGARSKRCVYLAPDAQDRFYATDLTMIVSDGSCTQRFLRTNVFQVMDHKGEVVVSTVTDTTQYRGRLIGASDRSFALATDEGIAIYNLSGATWQRLSVQERDVRASLSSIYDYGAQSR